MSSVGYGDISPENYIECIYMIFAIFGTGMVFAYSLNSIGNILENMRK